MTSRALSPILGVTVSLRQYTSSKNTAGRLTPALIMGLLTLALGGCGAISATTLRCGTDGDSSYLELVSAPQNVSQNTRAIGEMCAFAYEGETS